MRYNVSNLDQFINDKDRINSMVFEPTKQLVDKILENRVNLIEDKIKELIKPYADVEKMNMLEIAAELALNDLELKYIDHKEYEEYCICKEVDKIIEKRDYFTVKYNVDLEKRESWITITDIVRRIKKDE